MAVRRTLAKRSWKRGLETAAAMVASEPGRVLEDSPMAQSGCCNRRAMAATGAPFARRHSNSTTLDERRSFGRAATAACRSKPGPSPRRRQCPPQPPPPLPRREAKRAARGPSRRKVTRHPCASRHRRRSCSRRAARAGPGARARAAPHERVRIARLRSCRRLARLGSAASGRPHGERTRKSVSVDDQPETVVAGE